MGYAMHSAGVRGPYAWITTASGGARDLTSGSGFFGSQSYDFTIKADIHPQSVYGNKLLCFPRLD